MCGVQKGKYGTDTVQIVLRQKHVEKEKEIEDDVNRHPENQRLDCMTIVYGNKIYPKVKKRNEVERAWPDKQRSFLNFVFPDG